MFWVNTRYAKIWKIFHPAEKYCDLSVGTSEKKPDETYVNSTWPARCIGKALNQVKNNTIEEGGTYAIVQAKLSNERYKGDDGEWHDSLRLLIMEFAPSGTDASAPESDNSAPKRAAAKPAAKPAAKKTTPKPVQDDDEEDPWG